MLKFFIKVFEAKRESGEQHCPASALISLNNKKTECQSSLIRVFTVCICHFIGNLGKQNFRTFTVITSVTCCIFYFVDNLSPELAPYITHKSLLGILLDRCSDKAPR